MKRQLRGAEFLENFYDYLIGVGEVFGSDLVVNSSSQQKTKKKEQKLDSIFQLSQPKIINENTIEYTVPSPLNKVELEREFVYFLPYIREGLKNYSIQLKVLVKETEEKNFIYTPQEKYNRLKEINPAIDELRRKLDLDL